LKVEPHQVLQKSFSDTTGKTIEKGWITHLSLLVTATRVYSFDVLVSSHAATKSMLSPFTGNKSPITSACSLFFQTPPFCCWLQVCKMASHFLNLKPVGSLSVSPFISVIPKPNPVQQLQHQVSPHYRKRYVPTCFIKLIKMLRNPVFIYS
jgi:hypothetical protein